MIESVKIITKEGRKCKSKHCDGEITYHKTYKEAKEYRHTLYDVHHHIISKHKCMYVV